MFQTHLAVLVADRTATRAKLRRFLQLNDGKMDASDHVADGQVEALATSPANGSLRPSTWRTSRPLVPGFDARRKASRREIEVDLVRSSNVKPAVRSKPVVPVDEQREFTPQFLPVVRNEESACALVLEGPDDSLDDGETAVLADRAEPPPDSTTAAPAPKPLVGELTAVVSNEHPWGRPGLSHGSTEEGPDGSGCGLLLKHCEAHDPS